MTKRKTSTFEPQYENMIFYGAAWQALQNGASFEEAARKLQERPESGIFSTSPIALMQGVEASVRRLYNSGYPLDFEHAEGQGVTSLVHVHESFSRVADIFKSVMVLKPEEQPQEVRAAYEKAMLFLVMGFELGLSVGVHNAQEALGQVINYAAQQKNTNIARARDALKGKFGKAMAITTLIASDFYAQESALQVPAGALAEAIRTLCNEEEVPCQQVVSLKRFIKDLVGEERFAHIATSKAPPSFDKHRDVILKYRPELRQRGLI